MKEECKGNERWRYKRIDIWSNEKIEEGKNGGKKRGKKYGEGCMTV